MCVLKTEMVQLSLFYPNTVKIVHTLTHEFGDTLFINTLEIVFCEQFFHVLQFVICFEIVLNHDYLEIA